MLFLPFNKIINIFISIMSELCGYLQARVSNAFDCRVVYNFRFHIVNLPAVPEALPCLE